MLNYHYWLWDAAVPKEVCEFVINTCDWKLSEDGAVYDADANSFIKDYKLRTSDVIWAPELSAIGCIAASYIKAANQVAKWNYAYDWMEQIQIGRYKKDGHYDWHKDVFPPNDKNEQRKLSMSILLNDPSEFDGGELKFKELKDLQQPTLKQGSVIVFPSFLEHTVTPVTRGERYSAVTWVNGPAFC